MKKKIDPSLPFETIEIDGVDYKMCFNHGALAAAEGTLRELGRNVSLLVSGPQVAAFQHCRVVFACSLMAYQPAIAYDDAVKLCTFGNCLEIYGLMQKAWGKAIPDVEANPLKPAK